MSKKRQRVEISPDVRVQLVEKLFRQQIPPDVLVRENPRAITHNHSYGGISKFFGGLAKGVLHGTVCDADACKGTGIWLPPRVHCPDCWERMRWVEIDTSHATIYTHSMTNLPGAGFKASVPCPLISVALPGVCTKFMSYLSLFGEGEPSIGMRIKPVFKTKDPTYTVLDISWVPK